MHSHPNFVVQFDEEMFAFEAQLPDLCPAERVDFGVSLLDKSSISLFPSSLCRTVIQENVAIIKYSQQFANRWIKKKPLACYPGVESVCYLDILNTVNLFKMGHKLGSEVVSKGDMLTSYWVFLLIC